MRTSFKLMITPLTFLIVSGFIYGLYVTWISSCLGNIGCTTTPTSNVSTSSPLFLLLTGQYSQMFSSLALLLTIPTSALAFSIPWIGFTTYYVSLPSFYVPTLVPSNWAFGGFGFSVPNFLGGSFFIGIPPFYVPWLGFSSYFVSLGQIPVPWFSLSSWTIALPAFTITALTLFLGILMVILGLGISVGVSVFNFGINAQGARTLTILGSAILLWTFTLLFMGSWLLNLASGWGAIIQIMLLELPFVIGLYGEITQAGGGGD